MLGCGPAEAGVGLQKRGRWPLDGVQETTPTSRYPTYLYCLYILLYLSREKLNAAAWWPTGRELEAYSSSIIIVCYVIVPPPRRRDHTIIIIISLPHRRHQKILFFLRWLWRGSGMRRVRERDARITYLWQRGLGAQQTIILKHGSLYAQSSSSTAPRPLFFSLALFDYYNTQ